MSSFVILAGIIALAVGKLFGGKDDKAFVKLAATVFFVVLALLYLLFSSDDTIEK